MKKKAKGGKCQFCGCTDDHACDGGCCWANAQQTVCSTPACLKKAKKAGIALLKAFA